MSSMACCLLAPVQHIADAHECRARLLLATRSHMGGMTRPASQNQSLISNQTQSDGASLFLGDENCFCWGESCSCNRQSSFFLLPFLGQHAGAGAARQHGVRTVDIVSEIAEKRPRRSCKRRTTFLRRLLLGARQMIAEKSNKKSPLKQFYMLHGASGVDMFTCRLQRIVSTHKILL